MGYLCVGSSRCFRLLLVYTFVARVYIYSFSFSCVALKLAIAHNNQVLHNFVLICGNFFFCKPLNLNTRFYGMLTRCNLFLASFFQPIRTTGQQTAPIIAIDVCTPASATLQHITNPNLQSDI